MRKKYPKSPLISDYDHYHNKIHLANKFCKMDIAHQK